MLEEKMISGILHHRSVPDSMWIQYTSTALSFMLESERNINQQLMKKITIAEATIKEIKEILSKNKLPFK